MSLNKVSSAFFPKPQTEVSETDDQALINDKSVKVASSKPSKGWSITAMVVGGLILGIGACGGVGLLNIYGHLPLPTGLENFIGHIGHAGLWSMTPGVVLGGIMFVGGAYKLHYALKGRPRQPLPNEKAKTKEMINEALDKLFAGKDATNNDMDKVD